MSTRRHTLLSASAPALAAMLLALAAMLLAACSPGTTDDGGSGNGSSSDGSDSPVADVLADVVADVEAAMQPQDDFAVPSEPVDPSALAGRTVYYIPLTAQISVFQLYGEKIGEALEAADVDLTVCDGGANPSQIAGCVNQAVGATAAAIVVDNVPYGMAANALDDARAQGIPVLVVNQVLDPEHPADETLAYVSGPAIPMITSVADWIIADSEGQATVVLQKVTDNPSTLAYAEAAEQEFADRCPDCTVVVNEVSAANFPLIPSSTSSALLANPDARYVLAEFEHFVQPTIGGVQQSPNAADITIAASAATLGGLQMLQEGSQLVASAGQNFAYQGWATADAIFRLAAGQQVPEYDIAFRLFTGDNVGDIDLTEDAEASGEWYGPTDYAEQFGALWGLS
jgi:ribose transport system substrate-binding protein